MDERKGPTVGLTKALKGYLPIRWGEFLQLKKVGQALYLAPRVIRYTAVGAAIIALISIVFAGTSLYGAITVLAPAPGGLIREAVVGGDMEFFNPAIDRTDITLGRENNIPEKKAIGLLYLPLYTVDFPNFLRDNKSLPTIKPVLLKNIPVWEDSNLQDVAARYKRLSMELRNDIVWSNGKPITVSDVQYTFDRLKEAKGNPEYRSILANITFEIKDTNTFVLVSSENNPGLLYTANFLPISKDYFDSKNTEGLLIDKRSVTPEVTSGSFYVPETIDNPETTRKDETKNPIEQSGKTVSIVLKNNNNPNYKKIFGDEVKLEYAVIKRYDRISEGSGDQLILAKDASAKNIDLFERSYESDVLLSPKRVSDILTLSQKQAPMNTFLSMFFNTKRGPTGFLVNQSLRKYLTCNMLGYNNPAYKDYLIDVPKERRILPIAFGDITTIDCGTNFEDILDTNYTTSINPVSKQKQVLLKASNTPISLDIVGFSENLSLLKDLSTYFSSQLGITLNLITQESQIEQRLADKEYNIALLAYSVTSRDISENYSAKKRDLVSIPGNDRVTQYNFNDNLNKYTLSAGTDKDAKQALIDFFSRELVSLNLYQYQTEYNYSPLIKNLDTSFPLIANGPAQIELMVGKWYINTKRILK